MKIQTRKLVLLLVLCLALAAGFSGVRQAVAAQALGGEKRFAASPRPSEPVFESRGLSNDVVRGIAVNDYGEVYAAGRFRYVSRGPSSPEIALARWIPDPADPARRQWETLLTAEADLGSVIHSIDNYLSLEFS